MTWYLGVDAGGTKTLAIVTDENGHCRGVGMAGTGNFQGPGVEKARAEVKKAIEAAVDAAGIVPNDITAAYFGMAGADRDEDFRIVNELLTPILPSSMWGFENDASIGIWAGTGDGVGVGVICGTGTNVIGFNGQGGRIQIGGMGYLFGDYAGGSFIGTLAVRTAMRGFEGRGPKTSLYDKLCRFYGVSNLLDLVDWQYQGKSLRLGQLAPIVFEAASEGDLPAQSILIDVGRDLGISANAAIRQLFGEAYASPVSVVAMGSVFQNAEYPLMYDTFVETMKNEHPGVSPTILHCEPVFGAVYAALRLAGKSVTDEFKRTLEQSFPGRPDTSEERAG